MSAADKLIAARTRMMLSGKGSLVFYVSFLLTLRSWDEDVNIPTLAVNSTRLIYNPDFVDQFNAPQVIAMLMHEADHLIRMTAARRGDRDPMLWNIAHDAVINTDLIRVMGANNSTVDTSVLDEWGVTVKKLVMGGVLPSEKDYSADEIYGYLVSFGEEKAAQYSHGDVIDDDPGESSEVAQSRIMSNIEAASRVAESMAPGSTPQHVVQILEAHKKSQVDWRDELDIHISEVVGTHDWSYRTPDRRLLHQGMIVPSEMGAPSVDALAVVFDTSGSVLCRSTMASTLLAELQGVIAKVNPGRIAVVHCDCEVSHTEELSSPSELDFATLESHGGGGTSMQAGFDWVTTNYDSAQAIIVLTDGELNAPENENPEIPVVWVVPRTNVGEKFSPAFGRKILIGVDHDG